MKQTSSFREGQRAAWAKVQAEYDAGAWTPKHRAECLRFYTKVWKDFQHTHSSDELTHHYAGMVAGLKSARCRPVVARVEPQQTTGKNIYVPLLPEDLSFCELDGCGDIATWACYPPDVLVPSMALCDRCKQETMRDELACQTQEDEAFPVLRLLGLCASIDLLIHLTLLSMAASLFLVALIPLFLSALCVRSLLLER